MPPWAYPLIYLAAGVVFAGWAIMFFRDEAPELAREWLVLALLWPILVLITLGAFLGRR